MGVASSGQVERVTPALLETWPLEVLGRREEAGVRLWEIALAPGFVAPRHEHELPFFCVLLEGSMESVYERGPLRRLRYHRFLSVFHPAGTVHSGTAGPEGARILTLELESGAGWDERVDGKGPPLPCVPTPVAADDGATLARRLREELRERREGSELVVEGLALELLGAALRAPSAGADRGAAPRWLGPLLERLHDDLAAPLTLRGLAAELGIPVARLSSTFQRQTGRSLGDYRRAVRVEWVRQRLRDRRYSGEPLAAISLAAGFADQAHCTRVFKGAIGWTPARYRAAVEGGAEPLPVRRRIRSIPS